MPSIDLLDAFAELVVCIVFHLPHNPQSSGTSNNNGGNADENGDPLSHREGSNPHGSSQCTTTTSDDDAGGPSTAAYPLQPLPLARLGAHSAYTNTNNHHTDPGMLTPNSASYTYTQQQQPWTAQGSSASLDMLHPSNFTTPGPSGGNGTLGRWSVLSRPSSVTSLNGSVSNVNSPGGNVNHGNNGGGGGLGRWFNPFRARPADSTSSHNHVNTHGLGGFSSAAQRPLTATTAETGSSFSRIAEEDVLGYRPVSYGASSDSALPSSSQHEPSASLYQAQGGSGSSEGVPTPPPSTAHGRDAAQAEAVLLEPGDTSWEASSYRTPLTPLTAQTPAMFSVSTTSTPPRPATNTTAPAPNSSEGPADAEEHTQQYLSVDGARNTGSALCESSSSEFVMM